MSQTTTKTKGGAAAAAVVQPVVEKAPAVSAAVALAAAQNGGAVAERAAVNFEEDAGRGMENVDRDSIAIPFLAVLQKNSPQCDPDAGEYMPEAKPGMLYNTVTRELFEGKEGGVELIPCYYERKWLRWTPREKGGGFKGELSASTVAALRAAGKLIEQENRLYVPDDAGNVNPKLNDKVADTRVHYVIVINRKRGILQPAVISLASTQIKKSKALNSLLDDVRFRRADGTQFKPATWASVVRMTTIAESNEKGSWSGVLFAVAGRNDDAAAYALAREFNALVASGAQQANFESAAAAAATSAADEGF